MDDSHILAWLYELKGVKKNTVYWDTNTKVQFENRIDLATLNDEITESISDNILNSSLSNIIFQSYKK